VRILSFTWISSNEDPWQWIGFLSIEDITLHIIIFNSYYGHNSNLKRRRETEQWQRNEVYDAYKMNWQNKQNENVLIFWSFMCNSEAKTSLQPLSGLTKMSERKNHELWWSLLFVLSVFWWSFSVCSVSHFVTVIIYQVCPYSTLISIKVTPPPPQVSLIPQG
jgi:hypothetical protein